MSLEAWMANGWLVQHTATPQEIREQLAAADADLADARKHYRTIAALPLVLGPDASELADLLDRCRGKRHDGTYEATSAVSEGEADELIEAAVELGERVRRWLRSHMPEAV